MNTTDAPTTNVPVVYEDTRSAPFIYFDVAGAHGIMNGAIQVELASRILIPDPNGPVEVRFRATGRIRCSPVAATQLRDALNAALQRLEQPQQGPTTASSKLN